ncbi:type 3 dihydrofolate reductase [Vibrio clamense]
MAHGGKIDKENGFLPESGDRIIGKENAMPWHLPADFSWFKKHTLGKPVIMGRKTYNSIGRPLPGRLNIVISRDPELTIDGVTVVTSTEDALKAVGIVDEVMVIGGGSIYESYLPIANKLYLTFIEAEIEGDTRFPNWGSEGWVCVEDYYYARDDKNLFDMHFVILER